MQAKHDQLMRAYCLEVDKKTRREDGSQMDARDYGFGATKESVLAATGFYAQRANTAAEVTKDQMVARWKNGYKFTPGKREDAAVQRFIQHDSYRYEIHYWYDQQNIYVLFHCYPKR